MSSGFSTVVCNFCVRSTPLRDINYDDSILMNNNVAVCSLISCEKIAGHLECQRPQEKKLHVLSRIENCTQKGNASLTLWRLLAAASDISTCHIDFSEEDYATKAHKSRSSRKRAIEAFIGFLFVCLFVFDRTWNLRNKTLFASVLEGKNARHYKAYAIPLSLSLPLSLPPSLPMRLSHPPSLSLCAGANARLSIFLHYDGRSCVSSVLCAELQAAIPALVHPMFPHQFAHETTGQEARIQSNTYLQH